MKQFLIPAFTIILLFAVNRAYTYQLKATMPIADEVLCESIDECAELYFQY